MRPFSEITGVVLVSSSFRVLRSDINNLAPQRSSSQYSKGQSNSNAGGYGETAEAHRSCINGVLTVFTYSQWRVSRSPRLQPTRNCITRDTSCQQIDGLCWKNGDPPGINELANDLTSDSFLVTLSLSL